MSIHSSTQPKFHCHQIVHFFGGSGKIKRIQQQAICWTYHVEMSLGVEPDFGRVGAETTVVIEEQDLRPVDLNLTLFPSG